MESTVDKQPFIVMDLGSKYIKVGFSGEDRPRITIPNYVFLEVTDDKRYYQVGDEILDLMRTRAAASASNDKDETIHASKFVESIYLSSELDDKRMDEELNKVIELIKYIYLNLLKVDSAKYGLLLIDNFDIDVRTRGKITSKVMSDVRPEKFCMMKAPMLSLFATGRTTGLVLDCGDSITSVCAVYEGYTLPHAIDWQRMGGRDATALFNSHIKTIKPDLRLDDHTVSREMLKLKERACRVRCHDSDGSKDDPICNKKFLLPDRNVVNCVVTLEPSMVYDPMEIFFKDQAPNKDQTSTASPVKSITSMIFETINKCDSDIVHQLKDNIVVGGGNSMPEGFKDRIRLEVQKHDYPRPDDPRKAPFTLMFDPYRNFSSWVGGSMLASTSVFCDKACLSKDAENSKDYTNKVKTIFFN